MSSRNPVSSAPNLHLIIFLFSTSSFLVSKTLTKKHNPLSEKKPLTKQCYVKTILLMFVYKKRRKKIKLAQDRWF